METQKIANFLDGLEFAGTTDGTFISVFETTIGSEFVCLHVCDDVAFAMTDEFGLAVVEYITYRAHKRGRGTPAPYNNLRGVWENAMRAEFEGLVGLNAFKIVDMWYLVVSVS